ncbi:structural maintenance of chromosomes protein [Entamoeba nuttalli P19]|uniref:Structural maintenance of chromosomes protein n=1 Tax=Entamoeba nuttalli (strain P19) TaxID=1076696 RepID=K2H1P1_ENTNP|nr:structural maintenance of chromosomes protein [Entamoeba nuttalli P19]EKE41448.1 structural maintenance of chromosomes protein [Entamoeba nuttalli P19]|eukprot:XP_008856218.1 structural maintenance of chromosomes protein [Entamoeba nuttalli P19]
MSLEIPGTIERIELENFMCHKHLILDLSPQVNFIVGENGSGKSAILVALAICFGAKAQFTNRGKRASDIIKIGESYCKIIVYLRNRGENSLNHDKYGDTVIIERKITKEGGNTYKVSSLFIGEKPIIIGKKASDVTEVLDYFNIPIDNPCILLMQETSKSFLTATRGEDKYNFFLQATQLDIIKESYKQAEELRKKAKQTEESKKLVIPEMKRTVESLEDKLKDAQGIQQLKKRIEELECEEKWAVVRDEINKVKQLEHECNSLEERINELNHSFIEQKIEMVEEQIQQKQKEMKHFEEEIKQLEIQKKEQNELNKIKRKELEECKTEISDAKERLKINQRRLQLLRDALEESKSHNARDNELAKQDKADKIKNAENEIKKCLNKEESLKIEIKPLQEKLEEKGRIFGGYDDDVKQLRRKLEKFHIEKMKLQDEQKDALTKYHKNMPQFVKMIQKTTFEYEVFGPIGEFIRLKDNKWNHATESAIKRSNLASFIVRSENDKKKLRDISKRCEFDVQIYVYSIKFGDKKYLIKQRNYPTLIEQLEIEKSIIFNILVDHINIDTIAIAIDRVEGKKLFVLENYPKIVYLQNGSYLQRSGRTEAYFPYKIPTRTIYGGKNIDVLLNDLLKQTHQISLDLNGKEELRKSVEREKNEINKSIGEVRRKIREVERETRMAQSKKRDAENIIIKEPENIEELENNCNKVQENIYIITKEIEEKNERRRELENQNENITEHFNYVIKQIKYNEKEINDIKTHQYQLMNQKDELKIEQSNGEMKIKQLQILLEQKNKQLLNEKILIEKVKNEAEEYKFIDTLRDIKVIQQEKEKCKKKEQEMNSEQINYDIIEKEYTRKKAHLEDIEIQLKQIQQLCDTLEKELKKRKNKYGQLLKITSIKTMDYFNLLLKKKPGCSGKIVLDHSKKILDVEVSMEINQKGRNVKTLSGGERSFSTVCLLLSLWNVVDCPFRAMDEFDVYMDSMARKIAVQALMESTQSSNKRQYIFITPHNLDGVISTDAVKVFMMKQPDR